MTDLQWVEAIVVVVLVILVLALLRFAKVLHASTEALESAVANSKVQYDRLEATVNRMEAAMEVVADNLADSVGRADATNGPEGAAADAALRTGDTAEAIHERQAASDQTPSQKLTAAENRVRRDREI